MPWTWETPMRVRLKILFEGGYSQRQAARKLSIPRSSARYWINKTDRQAKPPGAAPIISNYKIREIADWLTGHYDRRICRKDNGALRVSRVIIIIQDSLNCIRTMKEIREKFNVECRDDTLLKEFARYGCHYHSPDCRPFISKQNQLKRWTFSIANWDRLATGGEAAIRTKLPLGQICSAVGVSYSQGERRRCNNSSRTGISIRKSQGEGLKGVNDY
ncbi:hypothetical protein B0O99DRAFT_693867 [Bisporella sp. PMI_857]|nr:hypothetical protein B0O99DRAFT_693867 [Bisporella sp. PMI_857]